MTSKSFRMIAGVYVAALSLAGCNSNLGGSASARPANNQAALTDSQISELIVQSVNVQGCTTTDVGYQEQGIELPNTNRLRAWLKPFFSHPPYNVEYFHPAQGAPGQDGGSSQNYYREYGAVLHVGYVWNILSNPARGTSEGSLWLTYCPWVVSAIAITDKTVDASGKYEQVTFQPTVELTNFQSDLMKAFPDLAQKGRAAMPSLGERSAVLRRLDASGWRVESLN